MAEFQTVAAAIDLVSLTIKACEFLKKVKEAETIAKDIRENVRRLGEILNGVNDVLEQCAGQPTATRDPNEDRATKRIRESVEACSIPLKQLEERVRGIANQAQDGELGMTGRLRVALKSRSISRLQSEVDAHINILSLNVNILQAYNQNAFRAQIGAQHEQTLDALARLYRQTQDATHSLQQSRRTSIDQERGNAESEVDTAPHQIDAQTIGWLTDSIGLAGSVYERLSEHQKGVKSQQNTENFRDEQPKASDGDKKPKNEPVDARQQKASPNRVRGAQNGGEEIAVSHQMVGEVTGTQRRDSGVSGDHERSITEAIESGDRKQIQSLLFSPEVDIGQFSKDGRMRILLDAVEHGEVMIVQKLLDPAYGHDADAQDGDGRTAFHVAAETGNLDMLQCLSKLDASINIRDDAGETPLLKAVRSEQEAAVRALFHLDADFEMRYEDGWSIIHHSVQHSSPEMTKTLLDLAPSDLKDGADRKGMTPLHHAAEQVDVAQAKPLLEHPNGVDVNVLDTHSRTALFFVARGPGNPERREFVTLFVKHGADPTAGRWAPKFNDYPELAPFSAKRRDTDLKRHETTNIEDVSESTESDS